MVSSSRKNSPTSAWWKTMIPVGSSLRVSSVERAVTPNPCFFRIVTVGNVVSKGRANAKIGGEEGKGNEKGNERTKGTSDILYTTTP